MVHRRILHVDQRCIVLHYQGSSPKTTSFAMELSLHLFRTCMLNKLNKRFVLEE